MSELKISPELLQISPEVQDALKNKKPVVALESTIISHGMPFPQNARTAIEVEETEVDENVDDAFEPASEPVATAE